MLLLYCNLNKIIPLALQHCCDGVLGPLFFFFSLLFYVAIIFDAPSSPHPGLYCLRSSNHRVRPCWHPSSPSTSFDMCKFLSLLTTYTVILTQTKSYIASYLASKCKCAPISLLFQSLCVFRMESATSRIQRIPSPSSPKAAPKLKYSHMVGSTPQPCDPGKLSPDLSHVWSCDISTTSRSCDIQAYDPGKVSHDLPRDWSSMRSQVATWSPDQARFRRMPSPLIGTWKTMGMINKSINQQTKSQDLGVQ